MEFGFKEFLSGVAGVSMIAWVAVIGLWHTYMFPRFFSEDSQRSTSSDNQSSTAANSQAGNAEQNKPWFLDDEGLNLNPAKALTAIGLADRGKYSKKSFVVADFNPAGSSYGVNRLYTTVLIGLAIGTFVLITHGLQSGFGLVGVNL